MIPADTATDDLKVESDWRCLQVAGPLDFSMTGVIASLSGELAAAKTSLFVISTFDTDYLLVKEETLESAIASLKSAGHTISMYPTSHKQLE